MKAEVLEAVAEDIKRLSEKDVQDILDIFNLADLDAVYIHLGLEKRDIDHAKLAEPHRPMEQARKLLNLWCNRKSAAATRGAMMRAMMRCPDCKRVMDDLKKKWEFCTDDSTLQVWGSTKSPERPLATGLWKQTGQFSTKPSILCPWGIVIHQDGDVAVTSLHKASVFSKDGHMKYSFKGPFEEHLTDIAITTDNRYILPSQNKIRFYDRNGNPLNYCNIHNVANKRTYARGLTVDLSGMIIAGLNDKTISIHHEDGSFKHKFATNATPHSLDVTSKGHIAVTFLDDTLQLMDYYGKIVRDVQRPQGIILWKPSSLCCSKQGDIFVVNLHDKTIYQYTADGECLGCIISGLNDPRGIAITEDGLQLYVVEYRQDMVKVFQRSDL